MSLIKDKTVFEKTSFLSGTNSAFIEELYERFLKDPSSIPNDWQVFFSGLDEKKEIIEKSLKGPSWGRKLNNNLKQSEKSEAKDKNRDADEKIILSIAHEKKTRF